MIANKVAHELAGVEPGSLIGLTDRDFMSPEAARTAAEGDREVLAGKTFEKVETISIAGETRTFLSLKPREGESRARLRAEKVESHPQPDLLEETVEVPRRIHSSVAFRQPLFNTASKHGS